jgi:urease
LVVRASWAPPAAEHAADCAPHPPLVLGLAIASTFLVTVHEPICTDSGNLANALYGSFLPAPAEDLFPLEPDEAYLPVNQAGAVVCRPEGIVINKGRQRIKIKVTNTGDRPIQVGSRAFRHRPQSA